MAVFAPVMPHGDLHQVLSDVFVVTGTSRPTFLDTTWQYSRNMTVFRHAGALTLVNTVRLDESGLSQLEALGNVENIVRLGAFHGMDDAFYRDRYRAKLWALPKMVHEHGLTTDEELAVGGPMPVPDASLFSFDTSAFPEGILHVDRGGGILVACDSLQNWVEADAFFDRHSAEKLADLGFIRPANIGPGWRAACRPATSDFDRLETLTFRHLLSAHGRPLLEDAPLALAATFAALRS